jgi:predicted kinase
MDARLVIVTGPPGSGKSTIARALALAWPAEAAVHVHSDDTWTYIVKGFIPPWTPESASQNAVVVEALAAQAAALAAGFPVLFDGIVGPWFLDSFRQAARGRGVALDYLVLRPDRDATVARGVAREGHPMRDAAVIGRMWDQFAAMGDLERHVLDTTRLSAEQAADAAMTALAAGRLRLD